jgi:pimeloyl-ACP methyl ester carboxylesterase
MTLAAMNRRNLMVAGAGIAAVAVAGEGSVRAQSTPRTFVLVHGAWHGGWCWRPVSDLLEKKGYKVFAPTLTGLADRSHLLEAKINVSTHIADIANLIKWEDLNNIILVGHSYGGFVISGVAEQLHDKIGSIVYLDAFVPNDGDSLVSIASPQFQNFIKGAVDKGQPSLAPPKAAAFVKESHQALVDAKTTPQPMGTYTEGAKVTGARDKVAKKTYIRAKSYNSSAFDAVQAKLSSNADWKIYEMPCNHDAMLDMPERLTEILIERS